MNDQLQAVLRQLSITQRIGIVFTAFAAVAMIAILVMFAGKPDYTPAFQGLSPAQAGQVASALRGANVSYELADAGTTILVPVGQLSQARIAAADAGLITDQSGKGYELFDNKGFGMSQFDEQVTYQRALEGELTRTIQAMEGVASARVAIVLAQQGVLSSQDTPASASVVVSMQNGQPPSSGLVQAIVSTVAGSVSGLSPENVVVTDDRGHVLAGAADSATAAGAQAKDLVEQQTKAKIQALVEQALGAGHASVAVSADVDMNKVEQEITTYKPVAGDNATVVSIHQEVEGYGGGVTPNAGGIPGAISNIPGLPTYPGGNSSPTQNPAPTASPSGSPAASPTPTPTGSPSASASASPNISGIGAGNYVKTTTTVNYNLSQTVQHVVQAPGVVKRLSVAVLVDQKAMGSMTAETLKSSIEAAIGADPTRGDVVAINAVPFAAPVTTNTNKTATASPDIVKTVGDMSGTIVAIVFAIVMLALFAMNSMALRRRAEEAALDLGPMPAAALMPGPTRSSVPELSAPADMPEPTPQARIQERLRMVADEKPDALVGLMHGWLREEDKRR